MTSDNTSASGAVVHLDPAAVAQPSFLRYRAPQAYTDLRFAHLKASVAHTAGNVQPIKVRPVHPGGFELVFGARRLRACLELGLPVAAVVQELDSPRGVVELDASNDDGQISLYERGCLYDAALSAGLFPSRRRLAQELGRDLNELTAALNAAMLPKFILECLADPRELKASTVKRFAAAAAAVPIGLERLLSPKVGRGMKVSGLLKLLSQ